MGSGRSSLLTCLGARAPHGQPALSGNAPSSLCTEPFDMLLIVPGLPRLSYFSASLHWLPQLRPLIPCIFCGCKRPQGHFDLQ